MLPVSASSVVLLGDGRESIVDDSPVDGYCLFPHLGRNNVVCFDGHRNAFTRPEVGVYLNYGTF